MSDGYTTEPTHVRIFSEVAYDRHDLSHVKWIEWHIDGADDDGNCTEAIWSYGTHAEAVEAIEEFVDVTAMTDVTWRWSAHRPRRPITQKGVSA